jgi:hypothetical protein
MMSVEKKIECIAVQAASATEAPVDTETTVDIAKKTQEEEKKTRVAWSAAWRAHRNAAVVRSGMTEAEFRNMWPHWPLSHGKTI